MNELVSRKAPCPRAPILTLITGERFLAGVDFPPVIHQVAHLRGPEVAFFTCVGLLAGMRAPVHHDVLICLALIATQVTLEGPFAGMCSRVSLKSGALDSHVVADITLEAMFSGVSSRVYLKCRATGAFEVALRTGETVILGYDDGENRETGRRVKSRCDNQ